MFCQDLLNRHGIRTKYVGTYLKIKNEYWGMSAFILEDAREDFGVLFGTGDSENGNFERYLEQINIGRIVGTYDGVFEQITKMKPVQLKDYVHRGRGLNPETLGDKTRVVLIAKVNNV